MNELADKLEALAKKHREPWYIEKEPHDYPDGTTHFTHVRYKTTAGESAEVTVAVANDVTPDLGELMCTLHNNLPMIIEALRNLSALHDLGP
jgi:hypothetical protein